MQHEVERGRSNKRRHHGRDDSIFRRSIGVLQDLHLLPGGGRQDRAARTMSPDPHHRTPGLPMLTDLHHT